MGRGATGNRNARHAAIVVAAVLPLVALVTGLTASVSPSRAFAASTTLTVLDGDVAVLHADGSFERGIDAQPLRAGDLVRTAVGARAVLTYFDGSTVELEPESELVVETVRGTPAGDVIIVMRQSLGRSWHVVTHLLTADSRYEVETPAATAAVRGTAFQVAVSLDGATTVTTTEGVVRTTSTEGTVDVKPGRTTHVTPGDAPTPTVPAPEPKRVVTVTLPSSDQAIVVDAYGRVVGIENGKAVRHVPGATITRAGELLVIRMPEAPNGTLASHVKGGAPDVAMTVRVTEAGATVQRSQDLKPLASGGATGGVEIRAAGGVPQVDAVSVETVLPKVSAAIADATATTTAPSSSTKRGGDGAKSSGAVDQGARRAKGATEEGVSVASQGDASPGKSLDRANARAARGDATAKGNDKKAGGAPDGASATAVEGGPGKSAKTANPSSPDDVSPSANGASSGAVAAADEPGQPAKGQAKSPASTDDAAQRGKGSAKGPSVGDVASNAPATTPADDPGQSSKGAAKAAGAAAPSAPADDPGKSAAKSPSPADGGQANAARSAHVAAADTAKAPSAPAATDTQTSASPVASADAAKASASSASAADTSAKSSPSASASAPSDSVKSAPSAPAASDQQKRAPAASADSTKATAPAAAADTSTKSSSSAGSAAPAVGETSKAASSAPAVDSGSKGAGARAKAADLGTSTKGDTPAAAGPKKK